MKQRPPRLVALLPLLLLAPVSLGSAWSTSESHSNASVRTVSSHYRNAFPGNRLQHNFTAASLHDLPTYPLPPPAPRPAQVRASEPSRSTPAVEPPSVPVMQAEASATHSATYLHRALSGPRPGQLDTITGTPSSFSYFMQVQPHPRGSSYRERTRQTTHVVNLVPHGTGREQQAHRAQDSSSTQFRAPFSGATFQSFPFGPIQVPSTFTHPNPLAGHYRRPPPPAGAAEDYTGHAPPAGFVEAAGYFAARPQEGAAAHAGLRESSAVPRRRPKAKKQKKPLEITVLGDPRRPNLGIVGVPGQDVYEPPPPRIREYDPYSGRFKVLTPDEAHDSREEYRRPGSSSETSAEVDDGQEHAGDELREDESYEVYETPDETHSLVPMRAPRGRASGCLQKDFLTGLLSPLINAVRPAIKQCQKQRQQQRQQQQRPQQTQPPPPQQFGRLHRPRGRPRKKPAKQRKQKLQQSREPYFEFRNPVHNYISGEPEGRGLSLGELSDGDADAEYLSVGEAERESRAEPQHREELFAEDEPADDGVFAPYSVYRTVLEPDRKFRPFVRFPFEAERSDLKAMVNDLIHQGTTPP